MALRCFLLCTLAFAAGWPGGARAAEPLLPLATFATDAPGLPPAGWEVTGAAPWAVAEIQDAGRPGRGVASRAVRAGASFLTHTLPATRAPYVIRFLARAHADASLRGLSWGLSQGSPVEQPTRAFHLALGPKGDLSYYSGSAWQGLAPFTAGAWHRVAVEVFASAGLYEVSLDGARLNAEPLPFWNAVTPDTLFFNNLAPDAEGAEILFAEVEVAPTETPAPPAGLRITRLERDRIALDWLPPDLHAAGFRITRNGAPVADLPGDATTFSDTGLEPSRLYIYRLTALGAGTPAPESRPSRPAADYTLPPAEANAPRGSDYDVLVVGATPGGIAAALGAAHLGARVALVEPSPWIGGMMAGGLGNTDFRFKETHGGLFKEFAGHVLDYYRTVYGPDSPQVRTSSGGYKFEPHVARAVFTRMLAETRGISLFRQMRATGVTRKANRITAVAFEDLAGGPARTLTGKVVIDATYEGDIAAYAGEPFRVGREAKNEFDEQHAGEIFWDMDARKIVWGSGAGDHRVQAYNYRLCMTDRADNRVPITRPEEFDRTLFLKVLADAKRVEDGKPYAHFRRVLGYQGLLPNDKWDINNSGLYWPSTDFVGANYDYPTADWKRREQIIRAHRNYIQGLLYFLQNDPELPEEFRAEANRWGLARDEFVDNDHWPTQLYVREARRLQGAYWFTENDTRPRRGEQRSPVQPEGVGVGDYSLDSHATQTPAPEQPHLIEGFFYGGHTEPYQIPFGVMVPRGTANLLVPVAVSATHIGLSTIRMEPTWMALGHAAGTAAAVSLRLDLPVGRLPVALVQDVTLFWHQVTIFLRDVGYGHPDFRGLNYAGLIGLFPTYQAEPDKALDRGTAAQWLWQWMRVRDPQLRESRKASLPADSPAAAAVRALAAIRALESADGASATRPPAPAAGVPFEGDAPLSAADAARWIARAHRASDRWHPGMPASFHAELERAVVALLEGAGRRDPAIRPEALTRGQFLRLLYLAARTATPR